MIQIWKIVLIQILVIYPQSHHLAICHFYQQIVNTNREGACVTFEYTLTIMLSNSFENPLAKDLTGVDSYNLLICFSLPNSFILRCGQVNIQEL